MKSPATGPAAMPSSGIREIMELAVKQPGVLHLEIGEPDFSTPSHIVEAAADAARAGYTKYTANKGLLEVRQAMTEKLQHANGIKADPKEIVVTTGSINALMESLMALVDPGEAILIPDPGWPNYAMIAGALAARIVRYPLVANEGFEPDLDELQRLATTTPDAKAIVINSPGNPTGGAFAPETIARIVDIAREGDLYLVSDECYEDIVFDGQHTSPGSLDTDGRVISVFSLSKSYAMTGWRVGYLTTNPELIAIITKIQEATTSCANAIAQKAAQAAITGDQSCVEEMRVAYQSRRDRAVELLNGSGLLVNRPRGAFYILASISGTGMDTYDFCKRLVVEHDVAVAPGETFGPGGGDMVRLSLAAAPSVIEKGIDRLSAAVSSWRSVD